MGYLFFPPPQPFMGGHQPLAAGELPPSITAVPVDNPIRATVSAAILAVLIQAWQPAIPAAQAQRFAVQDGTVASVPFNQTQLHIARAWQQDPQPYQLYAKTIVSVDNPPIGGYPNTSSETYVAIQSWRPAPPQPWFGYELNPVFTAVQVDNPPFGLFPNISAENYATIQRSWQPGPPLPWFGYQVNPALSGVTTSDPPFTLAARSPTYQALARLWDPPPPSPFVGGWEPLAPRTLPVSITAVQVDNPPFGLANLFEDDLIVQVARAWIVPPQPTQGWRFVPQQAAVVDNPPPYRRERIAVQGWAPASPTPWTSRYVPIPSPLAQNPPFGAIEDDLLVQIVGAWQQSTPYVYQRQKQNISAIAGTVTFDLSRVYTVAPVSRVFSTGPFVRTYTVAVSNRTYTITSLSYNLTISGPG